MKTVSLRDLHTRTGYYVRAAARQPIAVTDRGETIAVIQPAIRPSGPTFAERKLRSGFKRFLLRPHAGTDSTQMISEDRDR
ncbi:MAG: hypothetical protein ACREIA_11345 [Opitutaceae bacterium]